MGNRKEAEKHAIEASSVHSEEPKTKQRRRRSIAALTTSWGGKDCDFYFRWAESGVGFKAQAMEPPAETIGRKLIPLWDSVEAMRGLAAGNPKITATLAEIDRTTGGAAARPNKGRQLMVRTQPDKTTDAHLDAARRYRRVHAGMVALRTATPIHFAVLHHVFLPDRTAPEIELEFGQFAALVIRLDRIRASFEIAMKREKEPVTLETWFLRQIERKNGVVNLAREDAEGMAVAAVRAYESAAAKPPELVRAEREAAEAAEEPLKRRPKRDEGIPFTIPEPEVA